MRSLAVLRELPAHYEVIESTRAVLAQRREAADALRRAGFGPDAEGAWSTSALGGRNPLLELAVGEQRWLRRRFTHGGLLRWLTGRRFGDPERPFRELLDAERLAGLGIATPTVVAARARRAPVWGWYLDLVTQRVSGAVELAHALAGAPQSVRSALLAAAGRTVARMHAAGFVHADLHPRNLLVVAERDIVVLDLDRSHWRAPLADGERRDNLRRLLRYAERDLAASPRDCARFLCAYQPARRERHADWNAIRAAHASSRWLHAGGWFLERRFGRRRTNARDRALPPRGVTP